MRKSYIRHSVSLSLIVIVKQQNNNKMKTTKQLLLLLIKTIEDQNPIDGEIISLNDYHIWGLCVLIIQMNNLGIITESEDVFLSNFLENEILKEKYSNYPVTYYSCNYGEQNEIYYFKPKDWSIRIEWLQEIFNNLPND